MTFERLVELLGIKTKGTYNKENDSYIIDLPNSDTYGSAYTRLENTKFLELMEDNQVVTEEGSSLMYEVIGEPFIINLLADWTADIYQIVITRME